MLVVFVLLLIIAAAGSIFFFFYMDKEPAATSGGSTAGTQTELPDGAALNTSVSAAYPGDFVAFTVTGAPDAKLSAELEGSAVAFSSYVKDGTIFGLLAVPLEVSDLSTLTITAGNISTPVDIRTKSFPSVPADVPTDVDEEAAEKDLSAYDAALSKGPSAPAWTGLFLVPASGKITADFGAFLTLDGSSVGRSGGVSIAADEGTEVDAAADGEVVFSGEMSNGGKTVILSHGAGVYSIYQHLKETAAADGASVKKGERIGSVGMTGYVKTPQLYYSVVIAGTPVDPFLMTTKNPLDILTAK